MRAKIKRSKKKRVDTEKFWGRLQDYAIALFMVAILSYFFFNSIKMFILVLPIAIFFSFSQKKIRLEKEKWRLTIAFKDFLYTLSTILSTGYSLENAIALTHKGLEQIYGTAQTPIIKECLIMKRQIELNVSAEVVLAEFADRICLEEASIFADTIKTCKRTGGDIVAVTKASNRVLAQKINTKRDINTMVSGKRFEYRIMLLLPMVMLAFLKLTSESITEVLYKTFLGRSTMMICLLLLIIASIIGERILKIEV